MKRRQFRGDLGAAAVLREAVASAQPRMPRLGYLWIGSAATDGPTLEGLRKGLAERGYVEGRTFILERRHADGYSERLQALADELAALPVDIIFPPGTAATRAAPRATKTVPIVATTGDPVGFARTR